MLLTFKVIFCLYLLPMMMMSVVGVLPINCARHGHERFLSMLNEDIGPRVLQIAWLQHKQEYSRSA